MVDRQVQIAVAAAESVEALPSVVSRAMEAIYDSRSTAASIAEIIGLDPALVGRILRQVNSPYYRALSRPVVSLTEAILRLGYQSVQSALLTTATATLLRPPLPRYGLRRSEFWDHSVAVALSAREIARRSQVGGPEEAYIAGLLHDIGKVGLERQGSSALSLVRSRVAERKQAYHEVELAELGFDHAQVGELVAIRWGLPEATAAAIGAHHRPGLESDALAATLTVADTLAWLMGFPGADDPTPRQVDGDVLERLNLTFEGLELLTETMAPIVDQALGVIGDQFTQPARR